ncbi:S1 family peptidase [Aliarcobacter cryaerophilus]|uniref:S1 family peptidase n=1 Tax=Aliarcobacter cryaerophilus TaxID=28198 RepID=UPI0021B6A048|nr:serine protease [Aliarcobacter cryaerophilus]MCT7541016.1 serine protease [Aliarcobacter cryaerophilus]
MHEILANSTFRIVCGESTGSGFSYKFEDIIVTNYHVIKSTFVSGERIYALTEDNQPLITELLAYSDEKEYDFAILKLQSKLPNNRKILQPDLNISLKRGIKTIFSGFPHGIHDLLVHEAIISNCNYDKLFYLDGSINGGNSGGPIIEYSSGKVIGIITQRRFLSPFNYEDTKQQIINISNTCKKFINNGGGVFINGLDISKVVGLISQALSVTSDVVDANSNVGIGIGFKINFVEEKLVELGYK